MRFSDAGRLQRVLLILPMAGLLAAGAAAQAPAGATSSNAGAAQGQEGSGWHRGQGGQGGQDSGMGRVAGEVTAVAGAVVTVKSEDGNSVQIVTTDNTRVMKDRGPVKVGDLHPGDGLMAFGNLDAATHTLHAAMVMAEDAAQVKAMRENLGKTYITGRVTAIDLDDAKATVERPDHVSQTIGFDETTSFKRAVRGERSGAGGGTAGGGNGGAMGMGATGAANAQRAFDNGESITLADIKVGDRVSGTGTVKSGVFVPIHLLDSPAGQHRQHSGNVPGAAPAATGAGESEPGGTGPGGF